MDQLPKKFPQEVRKVKFDFFPNWQDSISSERSAEIIFKLSQEILSKYGFDLKKDVRVLEVGSGNAVFLSYLQKQGVNVIGTDTQPRGNKESSEIVVARIEQLPFPDELFGVVLSSKVFDDLVYNQDQNLMMKEIARVLKHNGIYLGYREFRDKEFHNKIKEIEGFDKVQGDDSMDFTVYKKS